jgi:DNA-binding transcriptional ArsR family regulator
MRNHMVTHPSERGDIFRALADPTRRAILATLKTGELPVTRIADRFDVSRPAISKHLRILREAELVSETRQSKNRLYRLNTEPLREVDAWLEEYRSMWAGKLANLKKHLESKAGNQ